MANWQTSRNYRKHKNADGTFTYTIMVDGEKVEVIREVYTTYAQSERQLEYIELDLKRDRVLQDTNGKASLDENGLPIILPEREVSLDKLMADDWDFPSSAPPPEEVVLKQIEIMELHQCLDLLDAEERMLIDALFFEGLTEREYSQR
ncbi:MAG: sigma-70 family RNA polymerase sigma factor, partial [Bacteroidia bacterium]|nr:sigma-70 family RNA polymerase sigma factor [Bacteroidia bacterium]